MEQHGMRVEDFFYAIKKRWKMIVGIIAVIGIVAISFRDKVEINKTEYKFNSKIYVYNSEDNISTDDKNEKQTKYNDLMINLVEALNSKTLMQSVLDEANSKMDMNTFYESLWVTPILNSSVIKFEIIGSDKEELINILGVLQKKSIEIAPTIIENSSVKAIEDVNLISGKNISGRNPVPILFVLGVIGSFMLAFLLEYFDDSIKNKQQLEMRFNLSVFGIIRKKKSLENKEQEFGKIRTVFKNSHLNDGNKVVAIIGIDSKQNNDYIVKGLSTSLAKTECKILRVQNSNENPVESKGLLNVLQGEEVFENVVIKESEYLDSIVIEDIRNNIDILDSKAMDNLLNELKLKYDYIVLNSPSLEYSLESQILVSKADFGIIVIEPNKTKAKMLEQALILIKNVNTNIVGAILS